MDTERRLLLKAATYSVGALALPESSWWADLARRKRGRGEIRAVGRADLEAVIETTLIFSRIDQRRGGGHARTSVVQYLTFDVVPYLRGNFSDESVRTGMFTAAGELAYLCGWMAFDNAEHAVVQSYFLQALKLAAEGENAALAGHILRAMAHQALDLGHLVSGRRLAEASMDGKRYTQACHRERALLGVVHARALGASGDTRASAGALITAEDELRSAQPGEEEPTRVFFFGEASLAHESACARREARDLHGAAREFRRSVTTRNATTFTRTHAVTLGYLGSVQARLGDLDEACTSWSQALDSMNGIRSGRTRKVAADIHASLSPLRTRGNAAVKELIKRSAHVGREHAESHA